MPFIALAFNFQNKQAYIALLNETNLQNLHNNIDDTHNLAAKNAPAPTLLDPHPPAPWSNTTTTINDTTCSHKKSVLQGPPPKGRTKRATTRSRHHQISQINISMHQTAVVAKTGNDRAWGLVAATTNERTKTPKKDPT